MQRLLATLLFLHLRLPVEAACPPDNQTDRNSSLGTLSWEQLDTSQTCVNISGRNFTLISGIPGPGSPLKELDLSHNQLHGLPVEFLNNTKGLERLFLQSNHLPNLPPALFEKTTHLKELRLEGNPLLSAPASLFHLCLETLSVACDCGLLGNIAPYCQRHNCTQKVSCHCFASRGFFNATDFYDQHCRGLSMAVYVALVVSILALILGAAVVYVLIQRKKGAATVQEKREPSTSNGAQARYISHTGPQVNPAQAMGGRADYENVFIDQPQEARGGHKERSSRRQPKSRSHQKVQEDEPLPGEQPIYANTQEVYYNYVGTPTPLDEDLYVLPDQ